MDFFRAGQLPWVIGDFPLVSAEVRVDPGGASGGSGLALGVGCSEGVALGASNGRRQLRDLPTSSVPR